LKIHKTSKNPIFFFSDFQNLGPFAGQIDCTPLHFFLDFLALFDFFFIVRIGLLFLSKKTPKICRMDIDFSKTPKICRMDFDPFLAIFNIFLHFLLKKGRKVPFSTFRD